jgi:hypothetical protein
VRLGLFDPGEWVLAAGEVRLGRVGEQVVLLAADLGQVAGKQLVVDAQLGGACGDRDTGLDTGVLQEFEPCDDAIGLRVELCEAVDPDDVTGDRLADDDSDRAEVAVEESRIEARNRGGADRGEESGRNQGGRGARWPRV